jgi:hypothetical protein
VPAAAVIPALKAYSKVVAVKKLVVGGHPLLSLTMGERRRIEERRVLQGKVGELGTPRGSKNPCEKRKQWRIWVFHGQR